MAEPLQQFPPLTAEQARDTQKAGLILLLLSAARTNPGVDVPGDVLWKIAHDFRPPCAFTDEGCFIAILGELVDAGLIVERGGRTRVAALSDLRFALGSLVNLLILLRDSTLLGAIAQTPTPPPATKITFTIDLENYSRSRSDALSLGMFLAGELKQVSHQLEALCGGAMQ
jgi:hypothetical protein